MPTRSFSQELREAVESAARVLLTGPIDPDGDSLGACLALARGISAVSGAVVEVAGVASYRYRWMPGIDALIPDALVTGPYDLALVLDGDRRRLEPPVAAAFASAGLRGIIDHHRSTDPEGYDLVLLAPTAASTAELVSGILEDWGVPLDADLAALIYTGLVFDHAAVSVRVLVERSPAGLRLLGRVLERAELSDGGRVVLGVVALSDVAECGAVDGDLEGVVDALVFISGVEVACLAVEKAPRRIKLSLRSRSQVDVASLARAIHAGGGGHARAAGVVLEDTLGAVLARLPGTLAAATAAVMGSCAGP